MNASNSLLAGDTDALGGDLRPGARLPRPIPCPETSVTTLIGRER